MIEIKNLSKRFDNYKIFDNLNLNIPKGKVSAILGPNGSGKTTLIKTVLGLIKPDSGTICIDGQLVNGDCSYRKLIGYMPQIARYPENLKVIEVIDIIKDIRCSNDNISEEVLKKFKLLPELEKPFKALSGGTRQKVSAIIALMFNPKILILDEPTAGLDPVSSSYFKDLIIEEKNKGKTIILTSHIMSEIEELAEDIIFLLEGKIEFQGKLSMLLENRKEKKLERAIANLMNEIEI